MKLVRFGQPGQEKPGLVDASGTIRDLSGHIRDIDGETLASGLLTLKNIDPSSLPAVPAGTRIGPCVRRGGHFIAVGLNYVDHAQETGSPIPSEPILFSKAPSC